jgi:hypothetical protein
MNMKTMLCCLAVLIVFSTCKKNELDALPPATQTGAMTFGCLIDGKAWVPQGGGLFSGLKPVEGGYIGAASAGGMRNNVWISANSTNGEGMDFYLRQVNKPGEYLLNSDTGLRPAILLPENYMIYYGKGFYYGTTSQYTGKIIVTRADTTQGVVSGTFEFTGYNPTTKQTISVTQGRFDVDTKK